MCEDKSDASGAELEGGAAAGARLPTMTVWRGSGSDAAGGTPGGSVTDAGATLGSAAKRSGGRLFSERERTAERGTAGSVHSGEPAPDGAEELSGVEELDEADEYGAGMCPANGSCIVIAAGKAAAVMTFARGGSRTIGGAAAAAGLSGANADRPTDAAGGAAGEAALREAIG